MSRGAHPRMVSHVAMWLALIATVTAVASFGGVTPPEWVPSALIVFGALGWLAAGAARQRVRLPLHPVLVPALAFLLLVGWQWAARTSVYPGQTLTGLLQLIACGGVLCLGLLAGRSRSAFERLTTALWTFTGLISAEALLQFGTSAGFIYWVRDATYGTPTGPFVYHNHFAGCMDLLFPVSVAAALQVDRRDEFYRSRLMIRCLVPALGLAAIVIARSRGGAVTLLFECSVAVAAYWPYLRGNAIRRRNTAAATACFALVILLAGVQPLGRRFLRLQHHDVSALERLQVSHACLEIWRRFPWVGSGFGTFATVYPEFQTAPSSKQFRYAHNEYAQALAETGAVGAALAAAFLVLFLYFGFRRRLPLGRQDVIQRAYMVAATGFLFHSAADFQFHAMGNSLLFFLMAGAAVGCSRKLRSARGPSLARDEARVAA